MPIFFKIGSTLAKSALFSALSFLLLALTPPAAHCYDSDVHYNLTDVLAQLAGCTPVEAVYIADADQSLDDNHTTTAFDGVDTPAHWYSHGKKWHAFAGWVTIPKPRKTGGIIRSSPEIDARPGMPETEIRYDGDVGRSEVNARLSALISRAFDDPPKDFPYPSGGR